MLFKSNQKFGARIIFNNETCSDKAPIMSEHKPVLESKKLADYTAEDLSKFKVDAQKKISDAIKHPKIAKETQEELSAKLKPLEDQLAKLTSEQQTEKQGIKEKVQTAISSIIEKERTFGSISISFNGKNFDTTYDPALKTQEYEKRYIEAQSALALANVYRPSGKIESQSFVNGQIIMTVSLDLKLNPKLKPGATKNVVIGSNKIIEDFSDPETDEKLNNINSLKDGFDAWTKGNYTSFSYGEPPQTFPPIGFNVNNYLTEHKITKAELKFDQILAIEGNPELSKLTKSLEVALTKNEIFVEIKDGKTIISGNKTITTNALTDSVNSVETSKEGLKITSTTFQIVSQQRRKVDTTTEYWPTEQGKKDLKVRKISVYSDGVVESETKYDKHGNLEERISRVKGSENIDSIEKPIGPPYKEAPALDEHGMPILDESGKQLLERTTSRIMRIKDKDGKVISTISNLDTQNLARKKNGLPPLSKSEYIADLAKKLITPKDINAFQALMLQYRYDNPTSDHWQSAEETIGRIDNKGTMLGDCEDHAFLLQSILKKQGKNAMVISLPGHAECITVSKDSTGKFHAISYGTFGVDINGNSIGSKKIDAEKSKGFDTAEKALASLQDKWHVKNSGNVDMGNGSMFNDSIDGKSFYTMSISALSVATAIKFNEDGVFIDEKGVKYVKNGPFEVNIFTPHKISDSDLSAHEDPNKIPAEKVKPLVAPIKKVAPSVGPKAVIASPKSTPTSIPKTAPTALKAVPLESPDLKNGRAKVLTTIRPILIKFISMNAEQLSSTPNLATQIESNLESALSSDLGIAKINFNYNLGALSLAFKNGKLQSINGTEKYAQSIIEKRKV